MMQSRNVVSLQSVYCWSPFAKPDPWDRLLMYEPLTEVGGVEQQPDVRAVDVVTQVPLAAQQQRGVRAPRRSALRLALPTTHTPVSRTQDCANMRAHYGVISMWE